MTEGALADQYEAFYREFGSPLMRQLRREAYGEDIGQHSWVSADELRRDAQRLGLCATSRLLDLGDGDCGPEQDGAPRHGRSAAKTRTASRIIFLISSRVTAATFSGMAWRHSRSVRPKGGMASQGFGLCIGHNKKAAHEGHRFGEPREGELLADGVAFERPAVKMLQLSLCVLAGHCGHGVRAFYHHVRRVTDRAPLLPARDRYPSGATAALMAPSIRRCTGGTSLAVPVRSSGTGFAREASLRGVS